MNIILKQAEEQNEIEIAKQLFLEYAKTLNFDLCFQDFDKELEELPGKYAPPSGRLTICYADNTPAGCIALRKIDDEICEMKRLYVKPEFRGYKLGRILTEKLISDAREIGYKKMRLDTIKDKMKNAVELYRTLGFYEIDAYYNNPEHGVLYMEIYL